MGLVKEDAGVISAHWLSFGVGFLSLSQEILWMRLFGYANESVPQAMMAVLLAYLAGIAVGAAAGRQYCDGSDNHAWRICGRILLSAAIFDLVAPGIFAWAVDLRSQKLLGMILIFISAGLKAVIFPIAHHLGTRAQGDRVGHAFSRVYAMNIGGATIGPIVTGFVLLGWLNTQQCIWLCVCGSVLLGQLCLARFSEISVQGRMARLGGLAVLLLGFLGFLFPEKLISHIAATGQQPLRRVVETRQGIVASYYGGHRGDLITGGNVYDGTTNLDPRIDSNGLDRVLVTSLLQPQPRRVLIIGMSVGTWLKLVTAFPNVKVIDVVEINPGYLQLIEDYPAQAAALRDPRVRLYIDDGRRWLQALKGGEKYDLIIMNASYHWRAFATNVLSIEFLREISAHMQDTAILTYNSTSSPDVLYTATKVFSKAFLYHNFVVASSTDFRPALSAPDARARLRSLEVDGRPIYPLTDQSAISRLLATPFRDIDEVQRSVGRSLKVISDHNLVTEYRYGRPFLLED